MKLLIIGGTGVISTACVRLAVERGFEVLVLNRGLTPSSLPSAVTMLHADIRDEASVLAALANHTFDAVANFTAYAPADIDRDIRLFRDRTAQYIFISSASAYQAPTINYRITESTPLANPFWEYSRNKILCEDRLLNEYRNSNFPITIIRPSLTFGDTLIPLSITSWNKSWSVVDRMLKNKPVLIHGDGANLWTATHNSDFAKGFVGLLGNVQSIGHAFHITSDEVLSWNQIYQVVADAVNAKPNFIHVASETIARFDPERGAWLLGAFAHSQVFDNTKIKQLVPDYVATTTFRQGIAQTIAHFKSHSDLQTIDPAFDQWCDHVTAEIGKLKFK